MKKLKRFGCVSIVVMQFVSGSMRGQAHEFGVKDSIEMARFSEPSQYQKEAKAVLSPDGRYFLVVTTQGRLDQDKLRSTLYEFDATAVRNFLRKQTHSGPPIPRVVAALTAVPLAPSTSSYSAIISDVRWSSNSKTIYFLGQGAK
jgi:hypothetical protein